MIEHDGAAAQTGNPIGSLTAYGSLPFSLPHPRARSYGDAQKMKEAPCGVRLGFRIIVMIERFNKTRDIRFEQALDDQQGRLARFGAEHHTKLQTFGLRLRTHQGT